MKQILQLKEKLYKKDTKCGKKKSVLSKVKVATGTEANDTGFRKISGEYGVKSISKIVEKYSFKTTLTSTHSPSRKFSSAAKPAVENSSSEASDDIDDLFGTIKQKKLAMAEKSMETSNQDKSISKKLPKLKIKKICHEKQSILSPEAPIERIDKESGYPVYKAHLLKVGEGGGTSLCPFDCDCCF